MIVCFVLMILGFVAICKWSDEAMDRIMEMEEEIQKNQITNFK